LAQANLRAKLWQPKSGQQNFSLPHTYFIEHLAGMTKKPPIQSRNRMEQRTWQHDQIESCNTHSAFPLLKNTDFEWNEELTQENGVRGTESGTSDLAAQTKQDRNDDMNSDKIRRPREPRITPGAKKSRTTHTLSGKQARLAQGTTGEQQISRRQKWSQTVKTWIGEKNDTAQAGIKARDERFFDALERETYLWRRALHSWRGKQKWEH
jgi:hypothetical protein